MKALELLYQYQQADEIAGGYMSEPIGEAIKELEELQQSNKDLLNTIIEAQKVIKNVLEDRK